MVKDYEKNKHRRPEGSALGVHIFDIEVSTSFHLPPSIFFKHDAKIGPKVPLWTGTR